MSTKISRKAFIAIIGITVTEVLFSVKLKWNYLGWNHWDMFESTVCRPPLPVLPLENVCKFLNSLSSFFLLEFTKKFFFKLRLLFLMLVTSYYIQKIQM